MSVTVIVHVDSHRNVTDSHTDVYQLVDKECVERMLTAEQLITELRVPVLLTSLVIPTADAIQNVPDITTVHLTRLVSSLSAGIPAMNQTPMCVDRGLLVKQLIIRQYVPVPEVSQEILLSAVAHLRRKICAVPTHVDLGLTANLGLTDQELTDLSVHVLLDSGVIPLSPAPGASV